VASRYTGPPIRAAVIRSSSGRRRSVTLAFRLGQRHRVRFVVTQLSPVCRPIGSFGVRGRAGVNRVRLRARVGRRRLGPGTYRLVARVGSQTLFGVRMVVARHRAVRGTKLAGTTFGNPCGSAGANFGLAVARKASARQVAALVAAHPVPAGSTGTPAAAPSPAPAPSGHPGQALGAQFTRGTSGGTDVMGVIVLMAVGLAMALLGAAAVPATAVPVRRVEYFLLRRRIEIALAGASMLLLAVLAYLALAN
jgi:hypothetical protein